MSEPGESRLYLGNFAFEETLLSGGSVSERLSRREAERACVWLGIAKPGDAVLFPERPDDSYFDDLRRLGVEGVKLVSPVELTPRCVDELVAWGPTLQTRQLADRLQLRHGFPPPELVRWVNSRVFQFELSAQLGCLLLEESLLMHGSERGESPSQELVLVGLSGERWDGVSQLLGGLPRLARGWLLKGNLGFSGRHQRRIGHQDFDGSEVAADRSWLLRTLRRSGGVAIEPYLENVTQISSQWEVLASGPPLLKGVTELLTDGRGSHFGNSTVLSTTAGRFVSPMLAWHSRVAEEICRAGYFGPLGIDAMVYQASDGLRLRPVQDINARWTMGRMALEWSNRFSQSALGAEGALCQGEGSPPGRAIRLSPVMMGGETGGVERVVGESVAGWVRRLMVGDAIVRGVSDVSSGGQPIIVSSRRDKPGGSVFKDAGKSIGVCCRSMAHVEICNTVTAASAGRVDQLARELTGRSRADLKGMFHHQCVKVNGQMCVKPGTFLEPGDIVTIKHDPHTRYHVPKSEPVERAFQVIFEDDFLLVVDKAADVLTVQTDQGGEDTLVDAVTRQLRKFDRRAKGYAVHRLDLGTSGLLVFGKSSEIASELQNQFRVRKADRVYATLVAGNVERDSGTIESRLGTSKTLQRYSVRSGERGERAVTHFEVARRLSGATYLRVTLETGRRNQIRVHFAELGHPVLGDKRYRPEMAQHPRWRSKRLALQAAVLGFTHPRTGEDLRFELPLPKEFESFLSSTR